MILTFLSLLFYADIGRALNFSELKIGMPVELTQNFSTNKLKAGANLICRQGTQVLYPKVVIGPLEGADARVRFFTVERLIKDPTGYEVVLQSNQMPCACVLSFDQFIPFLGGSQNFKMLIPADEKAMSEEPPIDSSCQNDPEWTRKLDLFDEDIWEI